MDPHSLRVLEFDAVLERLAQFTSNTMGREEVLALVPAIWIAEVNNRLSETREAVLLLERDNGLPMGGIHDIREAVGRAGLGASITARELLDVAATLGAARRLRAFMDKRHEATPKLYEISRLLTVLPMIENRINESIADNGEVKDSATPELGRLRSERKMTHSRLLERLNNILGSEKYRPWVQESIITERDGRYCIPVKSEYRTQFGGVVHDASASGATVFMEPGSTLDLGNRHRELVAREAHEVQRILTKLTDIVRDSADEIRRCLNLLAHFDMVNARARMALETGSLEPAINDRGVTQLFRARHPLLTGNVVPIEITIGGRFTTLLITGPNTGGKTVSLKTVALHTLMAQAGMFIPAGDGSEIGICDQILADIGDEQDIRQSLSTFSAHMKNIVSILGRATSRSLILLDEAGAGTDPAEGAALARAILEEFRRIGARVIATTHYGELKEYAFSTVGVENAAVEFDPETLAPTYRLLLGVPGSSQAFYIAGRLGLEERIVNIARETMNRRDVLSGNVLMQIEESRRAARDAEDAAIKARNEVVHLRDEYEQRVHEISDVQRTIRSQAEEEARALLRRTSEKAENIIGELKKMNRGSRKGTAARRDLIQLRRSTLDELAPTEPEVPVDPNEEVHDFRKGDRVRVVSLGVDGDIIEDPQNGEAIVQMGSMRATLPLSLLRIGAAPAKAAKRTTSSGTDQALRKAMFISPELMLRALRVEEAEQMLDRYLDDAWTAGLHEARIVHGKGTGALRQFVTTFLSHHVAIESFRLGNETEGGDGVTIVTFKQ